MLVKTYGSAIYGIKAITITIEVNVHEKGIKFFMVGMPDLAVKESHERIASALAENGFAMPRKQVTVNLAPADIRKEGSSYDLPIALGMLAANAQIDVPDIGQFLIMGELSLDGTLLPVKGVLPIAINARDEGFKGIIIPEPRITSYNVCYTKLLRLKKTSGSLMETLLAALFNALKFW